MHQGWVYLCRNLTELIHEWGWVSMDSLNFNSQCWSGGYVFGLMSGLLRLSKSPGDFSPYNKWQTQTQFGLAYWRSRTLFEIASGVGTSLTIDEANKNVLLNTASILVDMNLSDKVFQDILVERDGFTFYV